MLKMYYEFSTSGTTYNFLLVNTTGSACLSFPLKSEEKEEKKIENQTPRLHPACKALYSTPELTQCLSRNVLFFLVLLLKFFFFPNKQR